MRRAIHWRGVLVGLLVVLALGATSCGVAKTGGSGLTAPSTTPAGDTTTAPHVTASPARSSAGVPGVNDSHTVSGICKSASHPGLAAELSRQLHAVLRHRSSRVAFTAKDPADGMTCRYRQWRDFYSASVVKAIILCALLHEMQPGHHYLTEEQVELTKLMITESDNDAATQLWYEVGMTNLQRFLDAAKMKHIELGQGGYWGLTEVNAHDELLLLRLLVTPNKVLNRASRTYALKLMGDVISSQRWGVSAGAPSGVKVHIKNGWLPYPQLWIINSIGDFTGSAGSYSIAILTNNDPSMYYGVDTVQMLARLINHRFAAG
jgi:Beta-lactamase enzyme family